MGGVLEVKGCVGPDGVGGARYAQDDEFKVFLAMSVLMNELRR